MSGLCCQWRPGWLGEFESEITARANISRPARQKAAALQSRAGRPSSKFNLRPAERLTTLQAPGAASTYTWAPPPGPIGGRRASVLPNERLDASGALHALCCASCHWQARARRRLGRGAAKVAGPASRPAAAQKNGSSKPLSSHLAATRTIVRALHSSGLEIRGLPPCRRLPNPKSGAKKFASHTTGPGRACAGFERPCRAGRF